MANFYNVASNIPFLLLGILGVFHCRSFEAGSLKAAWLIFFLGIGLVSFGSAYYYLNPNNQTLVWDRLPMTIVFVALFAALLGEWVGPKVSQSALLLLVLIGLLSVLVWQFADDLRLYVWVQFMPLLVIPTLLALYRKRYSHSYMLALAILFYVLAKVLHAFDVEIFALLQLVMAGHAIKH
ncbi:MAG: ceramidase domain-containing protein [Arenimonas sp.]